MNNIAAANIHQQATATPTTPSRTATASPARRNPVLPKQRRNRDDPGGESRPMAEPTAQYEDQVGGPVAGPSQAGRADHRRAGHAGVADPPFVVPSQQKLGAAFDRLRFRGRGGDLDTAMAAAAGRRIEPAPPTPASPLSAEDSARLAALKERLGLADDEPEPARAPSPARRGSAPPADADLEMNRSAIYSPTTGRKLALSAEPGKGSVQIAPGTTAAKRPYKRGTSVACAFCRKRKIACGGPQEGDPQRRCGPCIQRHQSCEFPAAGQRLSRPRTSAGG
ncbi:hypothetical protein OH77DRAFT_1424745, partial [Trametes cingulata]